ncbi:MAG: hypothetical protein HKO02_11495 [Hyphomonadaceae bacterium]|nr:hypothetical protein [Hyphomonadaceae bacterium]
MWRLAIKTIIEQGLTGLANAGTINSGHWFVGHFGAEVLSLAFLILSGRIEKNTEPLVYDRIEEVLKVQAKFFETPLPKQNSSNSPILEDFVKAVDHSISNLCVDGHNTIFSALALRGFSLFPELARPEIIQGLIDLLKACESAGFDRYYGLAAASFVDPTLLEKFAFRSPLQAVNVALSLHREVITDREVDGEFYFFSGSRLHLITHAHALLTLHQLGYSNLVKSGLPSFSKHCICIDASAVPKGAQPYTVKQQLDPRQAGFWRRSKSNSHHGKLAYSVLEIFAALPQANQAESLKDLSSYWEFYD